jgi:arylsulfatase A-like enzyme
MNLVSKKSILKKTDLSSPAKKHLDHLKQMTGRSIILILICLWCFAAGCGNSKQVDSNTNRPNVLFISIDDLNDWLSPLGGNPQVITPNFDQLANEGMLFTNAHCASSLCNPSRAAVMTGIIPSRSGIYYNLHHWRDSELLKDALTIPQYFQKHGYFAAGAGKIYHNKWPDPESWDEYWPDKINHMPRDPMPDTIRKLSNVKGAGHFGWAPLENDLSEMGDVQTVNWIKSQLKKEHDKPFFLACGIYKPHLPWYLPREFFEMYPIEDIQVPELNFNDLDDVPEFARGLAHGFGDIMDVNTLDRSIPSDHEMIQERDLWKEAYQGYLASISFADHCLGTLIEALKESGHYDHTIIILWSDHGYHMGEKEHWRKETLWEEATRSVLLIRAPGLTSKTSKSDWPVSLMDIYPTLLELCNLPEKQGLDGNSLVDLLEDPLMKWDKPVLITYGFRNHAIRSKNYRYIKYRDGSEELYDHSKDPNEWTNLADSPDYEDIREYLRGYMPAENKEPVPIRQD